MSDETTVDSIEWSLSRSPASCRQSPSIHPHYSHVTSSVSPPEVTFASRMRTRNQQFSAWRTKRARSVGRGSQALRGCPAMSSTGLVSRMERGDYVIDYGRLVADWVATSPAALRRGSRVTGPHASNTRVCSRSCWRWHITVSRRCQQGAHYREVPDSCVIGRHGDTQTDQRHNALLSAAAIGWADVV